MSSLNKIKKEVEALRNMQKYCMDKADNLLSEIERLSPSNPSRRIDKRKEGIEFYLRKLSQTK